MNVALTKELLIMTCKSCGITSDLIKFKTEDTCIGCAIENNGRNGGVSMWRFLHPKIKRTKKKRRVNKGKGVIIYE